tara:strand:+ start:24210 stop:25022 length:813 start_codon:yes stop_codon:yes gene_type:complete
MLKTYVMGALAALALVPMTGQTAPINLNDWTAESYDAVAGFGSGNWAVNGSGGESVYQSVNGQPTIFYSDFNAYGTDVTGSIKVSGSDDDYIGFVLGFNAGDSTNTFADYLLVDWKKSDQYYNFGSPSTSPGSTAERGLAVSRVTGVPTADEFWGHWDDAGHTGGAVTELARATNLSDTGWVVGTDYEFTFDFGPANLDIYVDGALEISVTGAFNNGAIGFYNFSQAAVTYDAFDLDTGSHPNPVPEPGSIALLALGLAGLGFSRKKKAS